MLRVLITASIAFLLTSCVILESYPASWDAIDSAIKTEDCSSIAGVYQNKGLRQNGTVIYLANSLAPAYLPPARTYGEQVEIRNRRNEEMRNAEIVEISIAGDKFMVQARSHNIFLQWDFEKSKGEFSCKDGVVSILKSGSRSGDNVAAVGWGAIDLYRTKYYLMTNDYGGMVGVMLLIPAAAYGNNWTRFPVVINNTN